MYLYGEDIDILDSFTYLGNVVHNNGGSRQEVSRQIGLTTVLWTHSARVSGVVGTCADGQRLKSSSHW